MQQRPGSPRGKSGRLRSTVAPPSVGARGLGDGRELVGVHGALAHVAFAEPLLELPNPRHVCARDAEQGAWNALCAQVRGPRPILHEFNGERERNDLGIAPEVFPREEPHQILMRIRAEDLNGRTLEHLGQVLENLSCVETHRRRDDAAGRNIETLGENLERGSALGELGATRIRRPTSNVDRLVFLGTHERPGKVVVIARICERILGDSVEHEDGGSHRTPCNARGVVPATEKVIIFSRKKQIPLGSIGPRGICLIQRECH